jgi:drug/metabolite transporter (DMT)-like permease
MKSDRMAWAGYGSTVLFVLLWSSGGIFSRLGLNHASAFAFLMLRFMLALTVLVGVGIWRKRLLPMPGTRARIALVGVLMIGGYASCYFLALEYGITPGVLATVLGIQPILTLIFLERRFPLRRLAGLGFALTGLVLIVYQSIGLARFSVGGMMFALGALACVTTGAILQKRVTQSPAEVLPLQYAVSLLLCVAIAPFQPLELDYTIDFLLPLVWLGIIISVVAQLLLYHLIRAGNLVNVTSLFYLVPVVTAAMDYVFLGNRLSTLSLVGMSGILLGLVLVLASPHAQPTTLPSSVPREKSSRGPSLLR